MVVVEMAAFTWRDIRLRSAAVRPVFWIQMLSNGHIRLGAFLQAFHSGIMVLEVELDGLDQVGI